MRPSGTFLTRFRYRRRNRPPLRSASPRRRRCRLRRRVDPWSGLAEMRRASCPCVISGGPVGLVAPRGSGHWEGLLELVADLVEEFLRAFDEAFDVFLTWLFIDFAEEVIEKFTFLELRIDGSPQVVES